MPPTSAVLVPAAASADNAVAIARELEVLSSDWLHTGSVYGAVPASAYSILVLPRRPDPTRRHNAYHAWWPALAPSDSLHAAYRDQRLCWPAFAHCYREELKRQRAGLLELVATQLLALPARYTGVAFLGFRHAPGGDERLVRCPRRVLRGWLLSAA